MKKILVIENEAETRNLFIECLKVEGFYAISAENGLVGIHLAQEHLPDLILCDVIMPQLDGYGILTTLRNNPVTATIPFIFVTARATWTDFRKGMELGADDYLTKPCTVDELLKAIAACLEKRALLRQRLVADAQQRVSELLPTNTANIEALQSIFQSIPVLREVFNFIEANYNRPITISNVAQAVGYSPAYLTHLVRQQTGQSLYRWITHRRMVQACFLLSKTNQTVNEIAENLGYQNGTSFCRQFRQNFGKNPSAWRSANLPFFSSTPTSSKEWLIQSKD